MKNLLLFILVSTLVISCVSKYEEGKIAISQSNFNLAKQNFLSIDSTSNDYDSAQLKLLEIESLEIEQFFQVAVRQFSDELYNISKTSFSKIDQNHSLYTQVLPYLHKLDSIIAIQDLKTKKLLKKRKAALIAEEKEKKNTFLEAQKEVEAHEKRMRTEIWKRSGNTITKLKRNIKSLYNELMKFRSTDDFYYYGFAPGGPYYNWLTRVGQLKNLEKTIGTDFYYFTEFTTGDLETLGLEYIEWDGNETNYSHEMKKIILSGLK